MSLLDSAQRRFRDLLSEHQALIDQLGIKDDIIRVLRTRSNAQLGVIDEQAQAIARVLELAHSRDLIRADEIVRALEEA